MLIFTSFQHLSTMLADLFKSSDKCGTNVVANIENVLTGLMYTLTATTTPSQLTMKFIQLFFSLYLQGSVSICFPSPYTKRNGCFPGHNLELSQG